MREKFLPALSGALVGISILVWNANHMPQQLPARQAVSYRNDLFPGIVKSAAPSVVQVMSLTLVLDKENLKNDSGFIKNLWRKLYGIWSPVYKVTSQGAGIVLDKRGHIVTNYHVIAKAKRVLVKLNSPEMEVNAAIIGADPMTDLALLKISSNYPLAPVTFANSKKLLPGQWVVAIGNPFNLEGSVTTGVISALGRADVGMVDIEDYIQTDAKIFPGNSGGPLLDINAKVVGINTAVYGLGYGIGFAIPSSEIIYVVDSLIRNGKVARGEIGVKTQALTKALAHYFNAVNTDGAIVVTVEPGSPSELAGILRRDIIVSFDGRSVANPKELRRFALKKSPGSEVDIDIIRNGIPMTLHVVIGSLYK